MCCCWRLLLLLWVWCIGKILIFSDFIIVRMLFIFRKTYNKNTFLLRWFIAFICLNGRYFGDYIHTLMCCRAAMAGWWKKNQNRFLFRYFSHSFLEHHSSFMTIVNAIKYYDDDDVNEKEEVVIYIFRHYHHRLLFFLHTMYESCSNPYFMICFALPTT